MSNVLRVRLDQVVVLDPPYPELTVLAWQRRCARSAADEVPIVRVMGNQSARGKADAVGAVGRLGKPFDLKELTQLVTRAREEPEQGAPL